MNRFQNTFLPRTFFAADAAPGAAPGAAPAPFIPKATYGMIGLSGRITTPKYGVSKSGKPFLRFSLCTHDGKGGVGFVTCFVNDKYADILAPDLEKGQRVAVTGRVSFGIDKYSTKTPHDDMVTIEKMNLTINADHVELGAKALNRGITVEKAPEVEQQEVAEATMAD